MSLGVNDTWLSVKAGESDELMLLEDNEEGLGLLLGVGDMWWGVLRILGGLHPAATAECFVLEGVSIPVVSRY